jgi:hypothetical protein
MNLLIFMTESRIFGTDLSEELKGSLRASMIQSPDELPRKLKGRVIVPNRDRLSESYNGLATKINTSRQTLQALPGERMNFSAIGFHPVILQPTRGGISYIVFEGSSDRALDGKIANIGLNKYAIIPEQNDMKQHGDQIVSLLGYCLTALDKMKQFRDPLFPSKETDSLLVGHNGLGTAKNGGNDGEEEKDRASYREFVGQLIEHAQEIHVNPALFHNDFQNYHIYGRNGIYVAYNPTYGQGAYVVPDISMLFQFSKRELISASDASHFSRKESPASTWQGRIMRAFTPDRDTEPQ